jgi:ABC-type phosphate transport system substrate-binding protein
MRHRAATGVAAALLALAASGIQGTGAAAAATRSYAPISGAGSEFAGMAIEQWAADLRAKGITVDFKSDGSDRGRAAFIHDQVDFAASDAPFRAARDRLSGAPPEKVPYDYSYIPDVGYGTAFLYHITVGGVVFNSLKLSEQTVAKIFTGKITNWDNPAITRDNGKQLPNLPIVPVIDADGSGATYFFTNWMSREFPKQWSDFCKHVKPHIKLPCGQTEFYPAFGRARKEDGPLGVATFISSARSNGSIGFDPYQYALLTHVPVASLGNPAGRYVLPTPHDVTVALTRAVINENPHSARYLQENLNNVYTYKNRDSYPLSSYSYLIVPRSGKHLLPIFTKADGKTLSTFVKYLLCQGQPVAAELGDAALPANLVRGGLKQVKDIPGHVAVAQNDRCS